MRESKNFLAGIFFGLALLVVTIPIHFNEICCMFSATRYYGWPFPYVSLNKTVDTFDEAKLVETGTILELRKAGWEFNFESHMTRGFLGSPLLSLIGDFVLYFGVIILLVLVRSDFQEKKS